MDALRYLIIGSVKSRTLDSFNVKAYYWSSLASEKLIRTELEGEKGVAIR